MSSCLVYCPHTLHQGKATLNDDVLKTWQNFKCAFIRTCVWEFCGPANLFLGTCLPAAFDTGCFFFVLKQNFPRHSTALDRWNEASSGKKLEKNWYFTRFAAWEAKFIGYQDHLLRIELSSSSFYSSLLHLLMGWKSYAESCLCLVSFIMSVAS